MIQNCPNPRCLSPNIRKFGSFRRASDGKSVKRFTCLHCRLHFSSSTFTPTYRQHKRRVNPQVYALLSSGISQRRIALLLRIHRTTVARKLAFLAQEARQRQQKALEQGPKAQQVQFDDLITLEHTKCKPLSISLAVEAPTRRILGFQVSCIPASGPLAAFSRRKYGYRPNERPASLDRLFEALRPCLHAGVEFRSDEDPLYARILRRLFPGALHHRHPRGRSCITGQGELKKLRFDPLFPVNHTFAMLRANISRLIRRTWCTTKRKEGLEQHIAVYMDFHNRVLLKRRRKSRRKTGGGGGPEAWPGPQSRLETGSARATIK